MLIFSPKAGRVARIVPHSDEVFDAVITFPGFNYESLHAIITSTSLKLTPSYQINDTLGGDIFLISFGESIGPVTISGYIFTDVCDEIDTFATPSDTSQNTILSPQTGTAVQPAVRDVSRGIRGVVEWWSRENLTVRESPVQLSLGERDGTRAFVADLTASVDDMENRLWRFSMQLLRVPERTDTVDDRFAGLPFPLTVPTTATTSGTEPVVSRETPSLLAPGYDAVSTPLVGALTRR